MREKVLGNIWGNSWWFRGEFCGICEEDLELLILVNCDGLSPVVVELTRFVQDLYGYKDTLLAIK